MDLARNLFTVTADKARPTEAEMVAAVAEAGFGAAVQGPGEPAGPSIQPAAGAMPALVQEALDRAGREKKLVLIDFYADWCGPCQRMLKETYKDAQVVAELERFVFLGIDTDAHPEVAKRFGVAGIPDARVLAPDGTEVTRFIGFKDAGETLEILRPARGAGVGGR